MGGAGLQTSDEGVQASDDGVQTCDEGLQTCDEGVQTCVLACAALEQLCREGAWCRALVQRDVVPLLESLVRSLVITPDRTSCRCSRGWCVP